jgi:hypothetical protein
MARQNKDSAPLRPLVIDIHAPDMDRTALFDTAKVVVDRLLSKQSWDILAEETKAARAAVLVRSRHAGWREKIAIAKETVAEEHKEEDLDFGREILRANPEGTGAGFNPTDLFFQTFDLQDHGLRITLNPKLAAMTRALESNERVHFNTKAAGVISKIASATIYLVQPKAIFYPGIRAEVQEELHRKMLDTLERNLGNGLTAVVQNFSRRVLHSLSQGQGPSEDVSPVQPILSPATTGDYSVQTELPAVGATITVSRKKGP